MVKTLKGKSWKYGANIDTDVIIPARYLNTSNGGELAKFCMEDIDKTFANEVKEGDIIVADENFGCGSSREHAPLAIKCAGVSLVIAKSFARIFFRNSINIGLPILEHKTLPDECSKGDILEVDLESGKIYNHTTSKRYECAKFPPEIQDLIQNGGLVNYTKAKLVK